MKEAQKQYLREVLGDELAEKVIAAEEERTKEFGDLAVGYKQGDGGLPAEIQKLLPQLSAKQLRGLVRWAVDALDLQGGDAGVAKGGSLRERVAAAIEEATMPLADALERIQADLERAQGDADSLQAEAGDDGGAEAALSGLVTAAKAAGMGRPANTTEAVAPYLCDILGLDTGEKAGEGEDDDEPLPPADSGPLRLAQAYGLTARELAEQLNVDRTSLYRGLKSLSEGQIRMGVVAALARKGKKFSLKAAREFERTLASDPDTAPHVLDLMGLKGLPGGSG